MELKGLFIGYDGFLEVVEAIECVALVKIQCHIVGIKTKSLFISS